MLDNNLFTPLVRQLYRNMLEASGVIIDPDLPLFAHDTKKAILATDYANKSAAAVAQRYLKNTPLLVLLNAPIPFSSPKKHVSSTCTFWPEPVMAKPKPCSI